MTPLEHILLPAFSFLKELYHKTNYVVQIMGLFVMCYTGGLFLLHSLESESADLPTLSG